MVFVLSTTFQLFRLSSLMTLSTHDADYSRDASCFITLIIRIMISLDTHVLRLGETVSSVRQSHY